MRSLVAHEAPPARQVANLVRPVDAALGVASDATRLAARLHAAEGASGAISVLASPEAASLAAARVAASPHGSFADEMRGLRADEGSAVSPADEAALARAASFPPAFADDLAGVVHGIRLGAALSREAFAGLSPAERDALDADALRLSSIAADHHAPGADRDAAWAAFSPLAARVDRTKLDAAGLVVAAPVDRLVADVRDGITTPMGSSGSTLLDLGDVVIGGTGPTTYTGFHVLVVDLGGGDTYRDTAAGVAPGAPFPVSVVVDLGESNDVYEPSPGGPAYAADFVEGAAFGGVGLLVDDGGDDAYSSGMTLAASAGDVSFELAHAQGFGMLGVGALVDLGGNDAYASRISLRAEDGNATFGVAFTQGSALDGIGVLVDAQGDDAYDSVNDLTAAHALQDAYGTWSAQFCQGSALSLGAGALVDGADAQPGLGTVKEILDAHELPLSGSDLYDSRNTITSLGGTGAGGYGGQSNFFTLVCEGAGGTARVPLTNATDPVGLVPRAGSNAVAVGILADADGSDLYASENVMRSYGYNHGGMSPYCRTCHTESNLVVALAQGAAGDAPETDLARLSDRSAGDIGQRPPRVDPPASAVAGALVDGLGDDSYVSGNDLATYGYRFPARPENIIAESTLAVSESQGFGGTAIDNLSVNVVTPIGIPVGCGDPTSGTGGCAVPPSCEHLGRLASGGVALAPFLLPGLPGVQPPASGPVAGCFVGAMVDVQGSDLYNSENRLAASGGDTNYEDYSVTKSLGAATHGGLAAHVDGPLASDLVAKERVLACATSSCVSLPPESTDALALGSGSDLYNSENVARESRLFAVTDSLGSATEGIAAHVDAAVPIDAAVALSASPGGPPAVASTVAIASQNEYDSGNACTTTTFARNFGHAHAGLAAFVDVLSNDLYDQDPLCAAWQPSDASFGSCTSPIDVALFLDLGGSDAYPATTYPASGGGPANEVTWSWGPPFSLGIDAASAV